MPRPPLPPLRHFSTTSLLSNRGFFARPPSSPTSSNRAPTLPVARAPRPVAQPHAPQHVLDTPQSPNHPSTWSASQNPRAQAMQGPRFEQIDMEFQPQPVAAIELIQNEPIRLVTKRIASCDGGDGPLGHPKVFINLDKPGPKACPYCGIRYEMDHSHSHH